MNTEGSTDNIIETLQRLPPEEEAVDPQKINSDEVSRYWLDEAEEALTVLNHLFDKGDYSYALFFGHLAVEKMLKAVYVSRKNEHAPPIHSLPRLARMAEIPLSPERREHLVLITSFNIEARYPDLKRSFRKRCTSEFAVEQINLIRDVVKWLSEVVRLKR